MPDYRLKNRYESVRENPGTQERGGLRGYYNRLMRGLGMRKGEKKDQPFSAVELSDTMRNRRRRMQSYLED